MGDRVLLSCVAENADRWYQEVFNLALSVREFGGALSSVPVVANFVDGVQDRYVEGLGALDVEVRVVERFDARNPPSNKLRMLELVDTHEFDVLLAIDTDTIVVGDISRYADPDRVAIKPENRDPYPPGCWEAIYAALGVAAPSRGAVMTSTAQLTFPYYNSGVLMVPRALCATLREAWATRVQDVIALYDRHPDVVPRSETHWTNQLSLAVAVAADGIPVAPLPVAANLSTTVDVHPMFRHQVTPPFVLHYHNEITASGFVNRSRNPTINPLIDTFNRWRAAVLDLPYGSLPSPPIVRRVLREVESHGWYQRGPVATVRRHRWLAPLRRAAKRAAR